MSLLGELSYALITPSGRSISTVIPDVVMEEVHRDELVITQHPTEKGAAVTDHAFKRPSEIEMRCGFSNSSAGYAGYTQDIYQKLRDIQSSRRPFAVSTGKRLYRNMLLRSLGIYTDANSENILMVVAGLQEIIIVSTQTSGTGSDTTQPANSKTDQASPSTTGGTVDKGTQEPTTINDYSFAGSFNPSATPVGETGIVSSVSGPVSVPADGLASGGVGGDYIGRSGGQNGDIALPPIDVPALSAGRDVSGALTGGNVSGSGFNVFGGV